MADETTTTAPPLPPAAPPPEDYLQLTQARVPLDEAVDAFGRPDEQGRLPIVLITGARSRIRFELIVAGVVINALSLVALNNVLAIGGGGIIGTLLIIAGLIPMFIVRIPEGSKALLIRSGRYA